MPTDYAKPTDVRDWPVKVFRGTFSESKKHKLYFRYHAKRIRAVFV